ncbi:MAG: SulP family inorganic anion transporter, partial [Nocardiaceae bacterium]|nr:SulP family inorganic anion transporter [Nocardiaceae bacterium]
FHTLPPAGGFSQTAVALRAGARTQLSGIVTALLAVLVALFLAPVLSDLPQATLGAMVVVATLGLVDLGAFVTYWHVNRVEFWVAAATAVIGLTAGLLPAVLAGVLMTLYLVLRELNRPHVVQLTRNVEGGWRVLEPDAPPVASDPLVLRVDSGLYTANVRANTREIGRRVGEMRPATLVIDCSRISQVTTTVMHSFVDLDKELSDAGTEVYYAALPKQNLATVRRTELGREYESEGRVFATVEDAAAAVANLPRTIDSAER